jgi:hypothetical protein
VLCSLLVIVRLRTSSVFAWLRGLLFGFLSLPRNSLTLLRLRFVIWVFEMPRIIPVV